MDIWGNEMDFLQKPSVTIFEPQKDPNDPAVRNVIMPYPSGRNVDIGILGVPFDKGVLLGGGRAGAAGGPLAVREALRKYGKTFNIDHKIDIIDLNVADIGDVEVNENIEVTHERITRTVGGLLAKEILPVVIGGGHDISIGTVRALSEHYSGEIGGLNIDAHFDVREIVDNKITSGTPFRKLIEEDHLRGDNFVEIGAHDNLNSRIYYDYLVSKKVRIYTLSDVSAAGTSVIFKKALEIASAGNRAVFVSIDMDSVAGCYAPGTSAPDSNGFDPGQIREMAFLAGASGVVKLLDIVEINPEFDIDNRTSRLGASIIISFLNGLRKRKSDQNVKTDVL